MKTIRHYDDYQKYIEYQSEKTLNPEKRKKWLGEEWRQKIDGFKVEFSKLKNIVKENDKILCIGARTGQEVVALNELGYNNVTGIDIVEHKPYVIKGDMHNLDFEDESFDMVFSNIMDHSIYPDKFVSEVERVLKVEGVFFLQIQLGIDQDKYTEFVVKNPFHDIVPLFNQSFCVHFAGFNRNFAGMNFELLFQKDKNLKNIFKKYGSIHDLTVPDNYKKIWEEINLPIQNKKLDDSKIFSEKQRKLILDKLVQRGYYLTRIADNYDVKKIAEVGTAEGWQFFSFAEYCKEKLGHVFSCDPRDVVDKKYYADYKDYATYIQGDSKEMSNKCDNIDMLYIDGLHDRGTVVKDVGNLLNAQGDNPIWIFDDFDERFGCFQDILEIAASSGKFKVWKVGKTASGMPSHQLMVIAKFKVKN